MVCFWRMKQNEKENSGLEQKEGLEQKDGLEREAETKILRIYIRSCGTSCGDADEKISASWKYKLLSALFTCCIL